jgi:hypothetical protein
LVKITRVMRAGIRARLAHEETGFTPLFESQLDDMGITLPTNFKLPINFENDSRNFFMADITPEDFERTTGFTYPMMTLFAISSANQNKTKFHAFSGEAAMGLNLYISWPQTRAIVDMEDVCDAAESALYETFNAGALLDWSQLHDTRLVYNGEFSLARSKTVKGAESWRQDLYGRIVMDIHDR